MTRARIIDYRGTVEEVSDATFFERAFGRPPLTRQQREDEWRASIERYADMIEAGGEWAVPPPCLADARALVAERADLDPKELPNGRHQVAA